MNDLDKARAARALRANLWIRNALEQRTNHDGPVYHYTNSPERILESGGLWATSHTALEDQTEGRVASELVDASLARSTVGDPSRRILREFLSETFARVQPDTFVTSFTKNADSPFHWMTYADDGRGAALGFETFPFYAAPDSSNVCPAMWINLIYDEQQQNELVAVFIDRFAAVFKDFGGMKLSRLLREERFLATGSHADAAIALMNLTFKGASYRSENEVRLVRLEEAEVVGKRAERRNLPVIPIHKRAMSRGNGRYLTFPLGIDGKPLAVREVVCGPNAAPKRIHTLRELLNECGYPDIEVRTSGISSGE